jgi:hypothetical protein
MGLDWCLNNKLRDGVDQAEADRISEQLDNTNDPVVEQSLKVQLRRMVISPLMELGAKTLDLDDIDSVKAFQHVYDSHRKHAEEDSTANEEYRKHWMRPFDELVKEHLGSTLVETVPPETMNMVRANLTNPFATIAGFESFRGKRIQYCGLLPSELIEECFQEHDPEQMLDFADRLEEYLNKELINRLIPSYNRLKEISIDGFLEDKPKPGYEAEFKELGEKLANGEYTTKAARERAVKRVEKGENVFSGGDTDEAQRRVYRKLFWPNVALFEGIEWLRFWGKRGFAMRPWY